MGQETRKAHVLYLGDVEKTGGRSWRYSREVHLCTAEGLNLRLNTPWDWEQDGVPAWKSFEDAAAASLGGPAHLVLGGDDALIERVADCARGPMVSLADAVLRTIPFRSGPEYGYDPLAAIRSGRKQHTLRRQGRKPGLYEVSVDGRRRGLVVRVFGVEEIEPDGYLTDEFAWADGFDGTDTETPGEALRRALESMYPWDGRSGIELDADGRWVCNDAAPPVWEQSMKLWRFRLEWVREKGAWRHV